MGSLCLRFVFATDGGGILSKKDQSQTGVTVSKKDQTDFHCVQKKDQVELQP